MKTENKICKDQINIYRSRTQAYVDFFKYSCNRYGLLSTSMVSIYHTRIIDERRVYFRILQLGLFMQECKCMSRAVANSLQKGSANNSVYYQGFSLLCSDNILLLSISTPEFVLRTI